MNQIQNVRFARHSGKTKHHFSSKWETLTRPTIRLSFVAFALWAFVASDARASSLAPETKGLNRQGVQIWLTKGKHKLNVDSQGVILKGYDPVAYFTQKKAVKGDPKYKTTYEGATYYFSSAGDLAAFKASPAKYAPQYGGFCANGMKDRKAVDIDPNVFFVIKGKLYVCASPDAEKEFQANVEQNITKANKNWDEEDRWFY